jgi:hypothetical protein
MQNPETFMKQLSKQLALTFTAVLLVMVPCLSAAAPPHTGIQGQAFLITSYGMPIEVEPGIWIGIGAVQLPVATTFTVLSSNTGREVTRITTDANGSFGVSLHPGAYLLVPDTLRFNGFPFGCSVSTAPIQIAVEPKQFTVANVFYFQNEPCSISAIIH